ncbi:MAG: type II secretion system F family protein [Armatimonadetes bacterium]|nr:type II secretion system F family protein [Armatimonadota bacterium]MDW8120922.1 type II secretion system F family protein [Armatimonadota bacterium]
MAATVTFPEEQQRFPLFTKLIGNTRLAKNYRRKMMEAGLALRGEEFLALIVVVSVGLSALLGMILGTWWAPIVGLAAGIYVPNLLLNIRIARRKQLLEIQLADALTIISAGLSAGFAFIQGARMAADRLPSPISDELDRVYKLVSVGMPIEQALQLMAERVRSYDYDISVSAITVQLRRGGNLSRILSTVADTIRQRQELRGEIAASTAQARFSGWILMGLPFAVCCFVFIINPEWMRLLTGTELGRKMIMMGLAMQTMGMLWIRKLLQVEL